MFDPRLLSPPPDSRQRRRTTISCFSIVVSCALFIASPGQAQSLRYAEAWRWARFTTADGLPANRVLELAETPRGTPWVGTASGVAWYDGYQWFPVGPRAGLPARRPSALAADSRDSIFVVIGDTIFVGGPEGFRPLAHSPVTLTGTVRGLSAVGPDSVILLNEEGKLWLLGGRTIRSIAPPAGFPVRQFGDLRPAGPGKALLSGPGGIVVWNRGTWSIRWRSPSRAARVSVMSENPRGEGLAWIESPAAESGLWEWGPRFDARRQSFLTPLLSAHALTIGSRGEAVVVQINGRVSLRSGGSWTSLVPTPAPLSVVQFVRARPNGDLWVGSGSGLYLCRTSADRWRYLNAASTPAGGLVFALLRTRDRSLWAATGEGLVVFRTNGTSTVYRNGAGVPLHHSTGLAEDPAGGVWATSAETYTGAVRWNGSRWDRYGSGQGLGERNYQRVVADRGGRLWFLGLQPLIDRGTPTSGVYVYVNARFRQLGNEHPPLTGNVYALAESPDGTLWFGTGTGLSRWRKGIWTRWTTADGLRSNRIFTLAIGEGGDLWFGDHFNGLGRFDGRNFRYFTTSDGLVHDEIHDLAADARGVLWIATRGGLGAFSDGSWLSFGTGTGLRNTALIPVLPTAHQVYVGTSGDGVAVLRLTQDSTSIPRVVLHPPNWESGRIHILWSAFSRWGEIPQDEIETRYRVQDGAWSPWSLERRLPTEDLPVGEYVITVQARNRFGLFRPEGSSLRFTVDPPLFFRWEFLLPITVFACVAVSLVFILLHRRQRHARALRSSEATSLALLNASADPSYLLDVSGRVRAMNEQAARSHRGSRVAVGSSFYDLFPPEIAASRRSMAEQVLRRASPLRFEDTHGGRFHELSIYPLFAPDRSVDGVAVAVRDVTDRKAMETTLQATNTFLRQILESSTSIAIVSMAPDGTILFWNTGAENILGYLSDEMVRARNIALLTPPDAPDSALTPILEDVVRRSVTLMREVVVVRKDGRRRWLRITLSPEMDAEGSVEGVLLLGDDITDQRAAERETEQVERKLRLLAFTLNCARDAFVITDLENNILYVNQAFVDTYGYSEDQLVGKSIDVVRSAHAGDALARTISLATRQGGFTGEVINRRKDGHEFPVELWTSVVRNDAGEPVALVGVARDITGRKKAEEQIRLSLREKEVLLKEIHHRVKNNLQVISSLLSLQASRLTNTETLAAFRESQARVKSMALVHEELYQSEDLSCIDFGDYLHRLGASLVNMYRTPMSSIEVVIDAERVYLSVDAAVPCGLIVNELVSNAMKHAFAGRTRGTVRVSFVHCDPRSALTVQDDGIGLPAEIDVGATESLGLQLVNALVHQLGGTLTVDREGGTTFKVEFTRHGRPIDVAAVHHAQPQHVSTE